MAGLAVYRNANLIAGMDHSEDAGIYRLADDLALIQTVDFFTPIVDDPFTFGQIAAANSLSDVYAKGGTPITAMNIVCFPVSRLDTSILNDILSGGADKMREAKVVLLGGHSVADDEIKYGLSVTGVVHPEKVIFNRGCRQGDKLVLTKPLGTGIVGAAQKAELADDSIVTESIRSMATLNRRASDLMLALGGVHACTDITGFGLLGHACEMIDGTDTGMIIESSQVPCFQGIEQLIGKECAPGGLERNRAYRNHLVSRAASCSDWLWDLMFDPQTSGGLLISLASRQAQELISLLQSEGSSAAVIGEVVSTDRGRIRVY